MMLQKEPVLALLSLAGLSKDFPGGCLEPKGNKLSEIERPKKFLSERVCGLVLEWHGAIRRFVNRSPFATTEDQPKEASW
jgi:hypothetical protein